MNEKDFIEIDIDEIEPIELSDWEKINIEKNVLRSSSTKKYVFKKWKWVSIVAMLTFIFASSSIWLPVVANRVPIVQQLLNSNDNPQLQVFSDNASTINQIDESNGTSIELAEAFFDGTIVSVSYEMKHEQSIDEPPLFWKGDLEVNGNKLDVLSHQIIKKNDATWIGMFTARISDKAMDETINLQWRPKDFKGMKNTTLVEGAWNFQLELTPTRAYSRKINKPFGNEQYQLLCNQITEGKYITTLYFEGNLDWDTEFLMVDIQDNLGNVYEHVGTTTIKSDSGRVNGFIEVFIPDSSIRTLVITPTIRIVDEKTLERKELVPLPSFTISLK